MTWEVGSTDQQRLRAGFAVLSMGMLILLLAWGMAVYRGPQGQGESAVRHEKLDLPEPERGFPEMGAVMILSGTCLLLVFGLSILAFLRVSRRYREHLLRAPAVPTVTSDVWKMHEVPEMSSESEEEEGS